MTKMARQGLIRELVRTQHLPTQQHLLDSLRQRGVQSTQVTISRDLQELGIVKTPDGYRQLREAPPDRSLPGTVRAYAMLIQPAQNMVVLKTQPGNAGPLARALDQADWEEIIGTIAGDDTVLVIAADVKTAKNVADQLRDYTANR